MRKFNAYRLAIVELDLDLQVRRQVLHGVPQSVALEMCLFVTFRIHEVVIVAVAIEIFHINFIDDDPLDRIRRSKAMLEHGSGTQVAKLGLNESAQIARRAVLNAEHRMQIIVVLNDHARTQLCGWNRHAEKSPC